MIEHPRSLVLADSHRELGARMAPFAGYSMPIRYSSIKDEHMAVRYDGGTKECPKNWWTFYKKVKH